MENAPTTQLAHDHSASESADFDAGNMATSAAPPAFQLAASPSAGNVVQRNAEDLTAEELAAANSYNSDRYRYEAPTEGGDETSYQRLINMLNSVAGDQALYDAAAAATSVGSDFSRLVNAAQGILYPNNADSHDGQLGPGTLRDVMAAAGEGSTPVGLDPSEGDFIAEHQTRSSIYPHHENDRIGDFYISGGFMEPHGHSNKSAGDVLRTDGDWMEDAPLFNSTHVTQAEFTGLVDNLHLLLQDDTLRTEALAENAPHSPAFARMVYAAQLQMFSAENDIDGRFGGGTRRTLATRVEYLNNRPTGEQEGGAAADAAVAAPEVDAFVYQVAPVTEMYEGRHATRQGNNTIGVNFDLGAPDAEARLQAVGANPANVMAGNEQLNDDQINALFWEDIQNLGVARAAAGIANFATLPVAAKVALADICFSFGRGAVAGMDTTFAAIAQEDYHTAGDRFRETDFFRNEGNRGARHLDSIRFVSTREQDPRISTSAASDKNLGFDYVVENDPDEEVHAWYGGVVTASRLEGGYGYRVTIETDIRYNYQGTDYVVYTAYAHNDENFVEAGDYVREGDVIAEMGGTGSGGATRYGAHVDLRIWINVDGSRVDLSPNVLEAQLQRNQPAPADDE